jgi:phage-related minor tail protein
MRIHDATMSHLFKACALAVVLPLLSIPVVTVIPAATVPVALGVCDLFPWFPGCGL